MNVLALIATGAVVLASAPLVQSHGYVVDPEAQWTQGYPSNGWGSSIATDTLGTLDNSVYGYGSDGTLAFFEAVFPDSGYDSLGQFINANQEMYSDDVDPDCGMTTYIDSARSTMPATNLRYTGFTHPGPCEVWCDDNKVLFDYDCQTAYPDGSMAYDSSLCTDANRFTIYWLGVHGDPWQVFTDCVWLEGGSGSGSAPSPVTEGADTTSVSTATTTAPSTSTNSTASSGSVAGEASAESETSTAPPTTTATAVTTTSAPAATTAAPAATEKCTARRN